MTVTCYRTNHIKFHGTFCQAQILFGSHWQLHTFLVSNSSVCIDYSQLDAWCEANSSKSRSSPLTWLCWTASLLFSIWHCVSLLGILLIKFLICHSLFLHKIWPRVVFQLGFNSSLFPVQTLWWRAIASAFFSSLFSTVYIFLALQRSYSHSGSFLCTFFSM